MPNTRTKRPAATLFALLLLLGCLAPAGAAVPAPQTDDINVLMFWGSWCPNCPAVMKQMEQVRARYAGHKVHFVAVSFASERDPRAALQRKGVDGFEVMTDGDALFKRFGGVGVPFVVMTDAKGQVIAKPSAVANPSAVPADVAMELSLRGV